MVKKQCNVLYRVLEEIHRDFGAELSVHTEQTHTNITWLAAVQNRMGDAVRLLDQARAVGWAPRPSLVAVRRCP